MPQTISRSSLSTRILFFLIADLLLFWSISAETSQPMKPMGAFPIEIRKREGITVGLPDVSINALAVSPNGILYAATTKGLFRNEQGRWEGIPGLSGEEVSLVATRDTQVWSLFGTDLCRLQGSSVACLSKLPSGKARRLQLSEDGQTICLAMEEGLYYLKKFVWEKDEEWMNRRAERGRVVDMALGKKGEVAVAAEFGLFHRSPEGRWQEIKPRQGMRSWAPLDVRAVAYDAQGQLWFASSQGVGHSSGREWKLYTGQEGLPYNDFTTITVGASGVVWFGTRRGAIRFDGQNWGYRQGQRWIPGDEIISISVDHQGSAWLATNNGLGCIEKRDITLKQKAEFYEAEIDLRHRRTPYGYVGGVSLLQKGDKNHWVQHDNDNDGLWTSMYGAAECYAYAATGKEPYREKAKAAFEALRFLGRVTQGGSPAAPPGFVARTILPATTGNPNKTSYTKERDEKIRAGSDRLWKVLSPRWPLSADRQWYWKSDTSSDELDGHYFFYARYYDLVARTEEERQSVRDHVRDISDHLLTHNFTMVDWDGKPTRWAVFNPEALNDDPYWWEERGLNSLSILSYLATAAHITGDEKYRLAAKHLIEEHGYAANTLSYKANAGPGSGNQSDDEMAFMCYYNLLLYEPDPILLQRYALGLYNRWIIEKPELCPLFNFLAAAVLQGKTYSTAQGMEELTPTNWWLEESMETLKRFPMELVDWRLENSHRIDILLLPEYVRDGKTDSRRGGRFDGKVLPIEERFVDHWNHDPWQLDQGGGGHYLADGTAFLLPYYLGLYHAFIKDQPFSTVDRTLQTRK